MRIGRVSFGSIVIVSTEYTEYLLGSCSFFWVWEFAFFLFQSLLFPFLF